MTPVEIALTLRRIAETLERIEKLLRPMVVVNPTPIDDIAHRVLRTGKTIERA